jgi:hypothetical protein
MESTHYRDSKGMNRTNSHHHSHQRQLQETRHAGKHDTQENATKRGGRAGELVHLPKRRGQRVLCVCGREKNLKLGRKDAFSCSKVELLPVCFSSPTAQRGSLEETPWDFFLFGAPIDPRPPRGVPWTMPPFLSLKDKEEGGALTSGGSTYSNYSFSTAK